MYGQWPTPTRTTTPRVSPTIRVTPTQVTPTPYPQVTPTPDPSFTPTPVISPTSVASGKKWRITFEVDDGNGNFVIQNILQGEGEQCNVTWQFPCLIKFEKVR